MVNFILEWEFFSKKSSVLYIHLPISDDNSIINSIKLSVKPNKIIKNKYYSYAEYLTSGDFKVSASVKASVKRITKFKEKLILNF